MCYLFSADEGSPIFIFWGCVCVFMLTKKKVCKLCFIFSGNKVREREGLTENILFIESD